MHEANEDVAHYGCWALMNMASIAAGREAAIESGAPAVVVAAMRSHEVNADVARFGCWALGNIARLAAGAEAAVAAGAPAVVMAAMRLHEANAIVRGTCKLAYEQML